MLCRRCRKWLNSFWVGKNFCAGKKFYQLYLIRLLSFTLFQEKTESVDLSGDSTLLVDISDALSERDKVKFTVHTKVTFDGGKILASCWGVTWFTSHFRDSLLDWLVTRNTDLHSSVTWFVIWSSFCCWLIPWWLHALQIKCCKVLQDRNSRA